MTTGVACLVTSNSLTLVLFSPQRATPLFEVRNFDVWPAHRSSTKYESPQKNTILDVIIPGPENWLVSEGLMDEFAMQQAGVRAWVRWNEREIHSED